MIIIDKIKNNISTLNTFRVIKNEAMYLILLVLNIDAIKKK